MAVQEPPVIDFSPFYGPESPAKDKLVQEIREACETFGFFQIINHGISDDLRDAIIQQSKEFFGLPIETKERYNLDVNGNNRGYERLRSQNFEKRDKGDLEEGFYLGPHLPLDDPYVVQGRFEQTRNTYPVEVKDPGEFRGVMDGYSHALTGLAIGVLQMLARTLGLDEATFDDCRDHPVVILRLLHYPPQEPDASHLERGIGAHTDFGGVTILLQDETGGLQVWNNLSNDWADVTPIPGAFVVNLGNMMTRWTNDRYLSTLHRVINKSGKERYSVPFFFSPNPNKVIECLPTCLDPVQGAKYPPVTVHEWMVGRYADTYGRTNDQSFEEMRKEGAEK
ncbi:hypothetical protein BDV25DRAFT_77992 [Aspergillus avenaceus]|uniref:Fe2OG dioxygenase domain-containing protein n=1 Tax=Aspergillus avenaceus TaxID=36643 RepID=A0A5N6U147_ASPAV|nr:hypothetical protein BDV25DRAFT_77992 [Aspergillus avenaceus]